MTLGYYLLEKAISRRRAARERARRTMLARTEAALDAIAGRYGVREAYLFGSAVRAGRFTDSSDVDIAVRRLGARYWRFLAEISTELGREVDLVELDDCRFADRIVREGRRWTPKP